MGGRCEDVGHGTWSRSPVGSVRERGSGPIETKSPMGPSITVQAVYFQHRNQTPVLLLAFWLVGEGLQSQGCCMFVSFPP